MSKVKASEFRKMLMDLGYTPVHVWYESHGDGSHETFQQTAHPLKGTDVLHPVSKWGGKFCIFTVYVESDGTVSGFNQEISSHDYVLATQIREDQKLRPKENREYLPVQDHVSPCGTASCHDFEKKRFYKDEMPKYFRISGVAGHGEYAYPVEEKEVKKKMEDGWQTYPAKDE